MGFAYAFGAGYVGGYLIARTHNFIIDQKDARRTADNFGAELGFRIELGFQYAMKELRF